MPCILLRASYTPLAIEDIVLVEPYVLVQASLTPARVNRFRTVSPATRPSPRGPGIISTRTLPPFPLIRNGTEWRLPHLHSQDPQPNFTGIRFRYASFVALSIAF